MSAKRKRLTLKEKIELINVAEKDKLSLRDLGKKFGISKNQASHVLQEKEEIRKLWITNSNENSKTVKFRRTEASEIDKVVFNWFSVIRGKDIPVSGVLLQEKAKEVAESLGLQNFKASNGWLEKFKIRHNLTFKSICGEEKSVNLEQVTDWIEKLKNICDGYEAKNIYNADETGLFYRILPNKTMCFKGEKCSGGKSSKERLTVLLCCNIEGEFEQPLVIGKAKKPRCFKNINPKTLSVHWYSNKKSWMTQEIMSEWLIALDERMVKKNRQILLFLDNASSHPTNLKLKSVKLVFFPPNATSLLQPLDQGIIWSFKVHYKKFFLRHVISQATSENSDKLATCVSVLNAIQWITMAVKFVSQTCVKNCFKKAGFETPVITLFDESVEEKELSELTEISCPNVQVREYLAIDENLCTDETNEDIRALISPTDHESIEEKCLEDPQSSEEDDIEEEKCDVNSYEDALKYTSQLKKFMLNKEDAVGLKMISEFNIHLEKNACKKHTCKQTNVTDYFK